VDDTVLVDLTVLHSEGAFDELRAHAQKSGDDHPEGGAGTAEGDGHADTGDIAEPDGSRQGGSQGLEVGDLTRVGLRGEFSADDLERQLRSAGLDEAEVDGEDQCGEDQPQDDERKRELADGDRKEDDAAEPCRDRIEPGIDGIVDRGHRRC
jgi:hypothetical protein